MGIFRRMNDIVAANVNDLVDRFENPERMLRQAVREMEASIARALDGAARSMASERMLVRELDASRRAAGAWREKGRRALVGEDEVLARQALARELEHRRVAEALTDELQRAQETNAMLRRQVQAMQARLAQARRKLATLCARQRLAEARRRWGSHLAGAGDASDAFTRFERMERRVEQMEAEADAAGELTVAALHADFGAPWEEDEADVDAELQILREELSSRQEETPCGE